MYKHLKFKQSLLQKQKKQRPTKTKQNKKKKKKEKGKRCRHHPCTDCYKVI